uniref:Mitochondrial ribosomal protein L12 n=1 Tax=Nothobranchius furzeri TaxID=105023 RepID=A0A8C6LSM2_NOTFU
MYCTRRCLRTALRAAGSTHRYQQTPALCALRYLKTSQATRSDAIATPPLDGAPKQYAPKIHQLVNDIASLTLLEVSDLNELLKKTLNIQDVGMMPMGAMAASAAPAAQVNKGRSLIVAGWNVAKKLVESLPQEIRANVSKEEAEKLKAALETAGGTVVLE